MRKQPMSLGEADIDSGNFMINPYPKGFEKVDIPAGKSGQWRISKFEVTRKDAGLYNLRLLRDGEWWRTVPEGTYTRLTFPGGVMMSDTPAEAHEHKEGYDRCKGNVLINGLGLGFFLKAVLAKKTVKKVTVIELSKDVIKLVAKSYKDPRLTIIQADAFTWEPPKGEEYDYVWHDIWPVANTQEAIVDRALLYEKYMDITTNQGHWPCIPDDPR